MSNDFTIKPLSEKDVENNLKRITKENADRVNKIFQLYSVELNKMISMALRQAKVDDDDYNDTEIVEIERLKRVINFCPIEERFMRTKDKIWASRDHIKSKNADFFLNRKYDALIKKDHNKYFIETLIDIIKDRFPQMDKDIQEFYWERGGMLLKYVIEYNDIIGV